MRTCAASRCARTNDCFDTSIGMVHSPCLSPRSIGMMHSPCLSPRSIGMVHSPCLSPRSIGMVHSPCLSPRGGSGDTYVQKLLWQAKWHLECGENWLFFQVGEQRPPEWPIELSVVHVVSRCIISSLLVVVGLTRDSCQEMCRMQTGICVFPTSIHTHICTQKGSGLEQSSIQDTLLPCSLRHAASC
jgi:hypothetical protein